MKLAIIIILNTILISCFYVAFRLNNRSLTEKFSQIRQSVEAKNSEWVAAKALKERSELVSKTALLKYGTVDFLYSFFESFPREISLTKFNKLGIQITVSGTTEPGFQLNRFLDKKQMKLLRAKRTLFEASGKI